MSRIGMCGVVVGSRSAETARWLAEMLRAGDRSASDPSRFRTECCSDFGVGWVEPSDTDSQFVSGWNGKREIGIFLHGELFEGTGSVRPAAGGGRPIGQAAAAWLVDSYEKEGMDFLGNLNGWFGGFLIDVRSKSALLFNDRFGMGRIYYHDAPDAFFFSNEAKSLLKVAPAARRLDERSVGEWLSCGCVLQNRTLFQGIELLPPGAAWSFSGGGKPTRRRYFDSRVWETQPQLPPEEYYERLKATFPRILERYGNGRQRVAMSLTGGLDGRMIMSWLRRSPGELPCYTFNGPVRDCADVRIARKVARACGQPHHTLSVDGQFFFEFPALAEKTVYAADGAMDVTGAVELYANRLARQIAPVRLTGNYGSEILRGNVAFKPRNLRAEVFAPEMLQRGLEAARTYAEESSGCRLSFIAFKQMAWHHYARFAVERSELQIRSPYLDNELVALAFQAPPHQAASVEPSMRLIAEGNPELGRIPTDRGLTRPAGGVANRIHRCFEEFLTKAEYAYDYGMPDWLARIDRGLAPLRLERLFLGRQKFCHFRSWYRHQLSDYVKQVLLDPAPGTRFYVKSSALEPMVRSHVSGTANYTLEIHKLLTLELLHRTLLRN